MTVTQVPLRPIARGSLVKLWLAIALLVIAAFALARFGTAAFQYETTATGVQITTVKAGAGDTIKAVDGVLLEYVGRLPDGKVFDQTEGKPVPMIPQQVIPGFAEALQLMRKGGEYKIRIPAALAYGANVPPGGPIPPNSDLLFDVKIHEVVPNAALMQQGPPAGAMPPGE